MLGAVYKKKKTKQPPCRAKAWPPDSMPVNTIGLSHTVSALSHSYKTAGRALAPDLLPDLTIPLGYTAFFILFLILPTIKKDSQ